MPVAEPVTLPTIENETDSEDELAPTYYVICWNDPVNLMTYVTHVFMKIFGWEDHLNKNETDCLLVLINEFPVTDEGGMRCYAG